ncbi:peptide chain release factor N(5)-glutamine methyltransferase [uncultured Selenomonas sp.]|uniref:peptide chain release factor N(5)-glutamine methyltransferase n=1 Tax=uncultured Selenomonas sp. TaxID=159275 RepID=UPI0028DCA6A2|nr:peptide chain release factor N(5)-glutamine methyltransferase [uncultured Selenomonas sp.]
MMAHEVWTVGSILRWTEQYFAEKGLETPRLDAEVLLSHVLKKERIYLYVHFDEPLEKAELAAFREGVAKRARRMPAAYITGRREFMGLEFIVTPAALIPRPDTEILVEAAVERLAKIGEDGAAPLRFADIGTGTGAIALSVLKFAAPDATAAAVDLSSQALAVARENAERLGLSARVSFYEGDLFAPLAGETFAAILSNPPYIPDADIESLAPEVRCYEPLSALKGGADGMDFYVRLLEEAPRHLRAGGFLALEAGIGQAQKIRALAAPPWAEVEILPDLAGIERVVVLWKK